MTTVPTGSTDEDHDPVARARTAAATSQARFGDFFLSRFLDLRIEYDDTHERCAVELPYAPFLCNPQGSMHGGIITTAMDISMGHLCHRYLSTAITIEMQMRYFRPLASSGRCEAQLLRSGRRVVHLESRLHDDEGRFVAHATAAWHRLDSTEARPNH